MEKKIHLHADDYGMSVESSRRILNCFMRGNLDGISILPNGEWEESIELLKNLPLKSRIHINLVEGKCVSDKSKISLLVDEDGYFQYSFIGLFFLMLSPKRKLARQQISQEMKAQIQRLRFFLGDRIEIDSHQHVYMIPGVFQALRNVLEELQIEVQDMRIPAEPISPFLKHPSLYPTYNPENIIKNILLNLLYFFIKSDLKKLGIRRKIFMGILFAGCMDSKRVLKVLPDFCRIAQKKDASLELLFHPGSIFPGEEPLDKRKRSFVMFYHSKGRRIEAQTLQSEEFAGQLEHMAWGSD